MSRRVTMEDFDGFSTIDKAAVRAWLVEHLGEDGALPVFEVQLGGGTASFVRHRMHEGRILRSDETGRPETELITKPLKRPFPVEAT